MALISTRAHAASDYATGATLLAAPKLLGMRDRLASLSLRGTGGAILGLSAATDYELGIRRRVPMRKHLAIDAGTGALLVVAAVGLRRRGRDARHWFAHGLVGITEIGAALVTARQPGDRTSPQTGDAPPPPAPPDAPPPPAPPDAPPPPAPPDDDILIAREASAAAAEAARIGGRGGGSATDDPAMAPVYEAGGGEQEGWEEAEAELIENASHGEGQASPERDAFTPEIESDRSTAVYGEPDSLPSTEVEDDRGGGEEDTSGTHPRPG